MRCSGAIARDGPLLRAMHRADVDLLLSDAEGETTGDHEFRTPSSVA